MKEVGKPLSIIKFKEGNLGTTQLEVPRKGPQGPRICLGRELRGSEHGKSVKKGGQVAKWGRSFRVPGSVRQKFAFCTCMLSWELRGKRVYVRPEFGWGCYKWGRCCVG